MTTDIRWPRMVEALISKCLPGPSASVVVVSPNGNELTEIANYASGNELRPIIDKTYPLSEAAEAHRYSETRRARGKIVLTNS